jgi:hypothetical protein
MNQPRASLGHLGATLLDLVHGDPAGDRPLGGVAIHDPLDEPALPPHALVLTRGASWEHLAALLRSVLGQDAVGDAGPETLGGMPSGDLFALANAVAALIDAPVTIENPDSRVLAFSGRQEEADESRVETILGRQVPERYKRASTRLEVLDGEDGPSLRMTTTGPLAELTPVKEFALVALEPDLFAIRLPDHEAWTPVTFYRLATGERYLHLGVRATPKVS